MPLYEEKLISPLAIRFTQDHIRDTFRDGRLVEGSLEAIQAEPSKVEGYDVVLRTPFPHIEILRWCAPQGDAQSRTEHWHTLDNRRLYCLQRAAVKLWPKRVAAVVEILYADAGRVRRKYDSVTRGLAVTIAAHLDGPQLDRWDWREQVLPLEVGSLGEDVGVLASVLQDDAAKDVDALPNAPEPASTALAPAPGGEWPQRPTPDAKLHPQAGAESTPSTTDVGSEESDGVGSDGDCSPRLRRAVEGVWTGNNGKWYQVDFLGGSSWAVTRRGSEGYERFSLWHDAENDRIWWGAELKCFLVASELREAGEMKWYAAHDDARTRPHLVWYRGKPRGGATRLSGADERIAASAIREINGQLAGQVGERKVWIPRWSERFGVHLGPFRAFLASQPEEFVLIAGEGSRFSIRKPGEEEGRACRRAGGRGGGGEGPELLQPTDAGAQARSEGCGKRWVAVGSK